MNDTVKEWISKAEGDYKTAKREFAAESDPNYDAVCFHAQQCVEKLMKALLINRGATPPKTHDLTTLDNEIGRILKEWSSSPDELRMLSNASVAFRYPGESADKNEAAESLANCDNLRNRLLGLLK